MHAINSSWDFVPVSHLRPAGMAIVIRRLSPGKEKNTGAGVLIVTS